ncbi:MAG: type II secretion system minor pseudopilin GspK [Pseudomonadota bacterium]
MRSRHSSTQQGAALVTVLMIVAAMSAIGVALTQSVTSATQRARALDGQSQLRFYAVSAEEAVKSRLGEMLSQVEGRLTLDMPGLNEAQTLPVDGGGVSFIVRDASNCFDLNALVRNNDGLGLGADPDEVEAYVRLLQAIEFDRSEATTLAASLVDWMDDNQSPGQGGAEDGYYLGLRPSYRTSSQTLEAVDELRAIRDYEAEILVQLRDLVCTRPHGAVVSNSVLNINTLTEAQAPLLIDVLSGAIEIEDAVQLIASRPLGGWPSLDEFLAEPVITAVSPEFIKRDRIDTVSRYMEVSAELTYRTQMMRIQLLFEVRAGRPIATLRRERVG